ncbi:MAG: hypothetical protein AAF821_14265 [Cyanobacteria bacterium P01_D01_bin.156]
MSQSRQFKAMASTRTGASPDADTLVDTYAEDLMDEIFEDVDRILAGDDDAIFAETLEPATSSVFQAEAVTVPAMIVPVLTEQAVKADAAESSVEVPKTRKGAQADAPQTNSHSSQRRSWRKVVLGVAALSALAALGFWGMRQQKFVLQPVAPAPSVVPATTPAVSAEGAFGEYLQRSLRIISGERAAQTESQSPSVVATSPTTSTTQQPTGRPGVIERVFVPLLQPGARTTDQTPAATLPAPNTTNADSGTTTTAAAPVPNIAAVNTYELVGVLELGDRSAALFDVNGTSQRIYIGETIGASGWSIVSIENEEVVVRRNGEVRSIYIGQKF